MQGCFCKLETTLGDVWLAATGEGLVYCSTPVEHPGKMHGWLRDKLPSIEWAEGENEFTQQAKEQLCAYFQGQGKVLDTKMHLVGTDFQKQVWLALAEIPYGGTRTYGEIAAQVGRPKGSRAVGQANNRNPISLFVP